VLELCATCWGAMQPHQHVEMPQAARLPAASLPEPVWQAVRAAATATPTCAGADVGVAAASACCSSVSMSTSGAPTLTRSPTLWYVLRMTPAYLQQGGCMRVIAVLANRACVHAGQGESRGVQPSTCMLVLAGCCCYWSCCKVWRRPQAHGHVGSTLAPGLCRAGTGMP
jgi:hypothetical protein